MFPRNIIQLLLLSVMLSHVRMAAPGDTEKFPDLTADEVAELNLADRMASELSIWAERLANASRTDHREFCRAAETAVRDIGNFITKLDISVKTNGIFASKLRTNNSTNAFKPFEEVNQKLAGLEQKLQTATTSIRATQETAHTLQTYRDCHNAVRNGAQKRSLIMSRMHTARTKHQLARLTEEFTNWYETSELDARLANLHRAATRETSSDVGANLFQSYAELHSCSTSRLAELMLGVVHDLELGSELQLAYHFFRNGARRASEHLVKAKSDLYELRSAFDRHYWYCLSNTRTVASRVVLRMIKNFLSRNRTAFATQVEKELESNFHRFNWAVAVGASDLLPISTLDASNFFTLPTTPRVLVSFADSEQTLRCSDANLTTTRLIFRCPSDSCAVVASTGTIGSRSCRGESVVGAERDTDWIVSILSNRESPCSSPDACNGHGVCRHSAGLTRPVCQCEPEFQGDHCDVKYGIISEFNPVALFRGIRKAFETEINELLFSREMNRSRIKESVRHTMQVIGHLVKNIIGNQSKNERMGLFQNLTRARKRSAYFSMCSHSFKGLTLNISCSPGGLLPSSLQVTSRRDSFDRLALTGEPRCDHDLSSWSSWSDCSTSCGAGYQTRCKCRGNDCSRRDFDTKPCHRGDCCVAKFGERNFHRCSSSTSAEGCIAKDRVCDGHPDCLDASDETNCDFLTAENRLVSFHAYDRTGKTELDSHTVNCYCTTGCIFITEPYCSVRHSNNWRDNRDTKFQIFSPDRRSGEAIHSGDTIGIKLQWSSQRWLSCLLHYNRPQKCTVRSCPADDVNRIRTNCPSERFVIYSVRNEGRCMGQSNCMGRPIRQGDFVALKHANGWLSANNAQGGLEVKRFPESCLQRASMRRAPGCLRSEVWQIYYYNG